MTPQEAIKQIEKAAHFLSGASGPAYWALHEFGNALRYRSELMDIRGEAKNALTGCLELPTPAFRLATMEALFASRVPPEPMREQGSDAIMMMAVDEEKYEVIPLLHEHGYSLAQDRNWFAVLKPKILQGDWPHVELIAPKLLISQVTSSLFNSLFDVGRHHQGIRQGQLTGFNPDTIEKLSHFETDEDITRSVSFACALSASGRPMGGQPGAWETRLEDEAQMEALAKLVQIGWLDVDVAGAQFPDGHYQKQLIQCLARAQAITLDQATGSAPRPSKPIGRL